MAKQIVSGRRLSPALMFWSAVALLVIGSIFSAVSTVITVYNTMVQSKVRVEQALSNLESVYQRRYALVENLVTIIKETKGFERYQIEVEQALLPKLAEAKAQATKLEITVPQAVSTRIAHETQFSAGLMSVLEKILVLAQHYPQITDPVLKDRTATFEALTGLKTSLTQLEDSVLERREGLNASIQTYNQNIQIFPANVFAASWGFTKLTGFEVLSPEARHDVKVAF